MAMKAAVPIRVFQVSVTTDGVSTLLVTCRSEDAASALVKALEGLKRDGSLVLTGIDTQFSAAAADVDVVLPVDGIADAIAQGYLVRSIVVTAADVPASGVLATIAGASVADTPPSN